VLPLLSEKRAVITGAQLTEPIAAAQVQLEHLRQPIIDQPDCPRNVRS
jgi:hypothetical protein